MHRREGDLLPRNPQNSSGGRGGRGYLPWYQVPAKGYKYRGLKPAHSVRPTTDNFTQRNRVKGWQLVDLLLLVNVCVTALASPCPHAARADPKRSRLRTILALLDIDARGGGPVSRPRRVGNRATGNLPRIFRSITMLVFFFCLYRAICCKCWSAVIADFHR
jgi:hypothetical protein